MILFFLISNNPLSNSNSLIISKIIAFSFLFSLFSFSIIFIIGFSSFSCFNSRKLFSVRVLYDTSLYLISILNSPSSFFNILILSLNFSFNKCESNVNEYSLFFSIYNKAFCLVKLIVSLTSFFL